MHSKGIPCSRNATGHWRWDPRGVMHGDLIEFRYDTNANGMCKWIMLRNGLQFHHNVIRYIHGRVINYKWIPIKLCVKIAILLIKIQQVNEKFDCVNIPYHLYFKTMTGLGLFNAAVSAQSHFCDIETPRTVLLSKQNKRIPSFEEESSMWQINNQISTP